MLHTPTQFKTKLALSASLTPSKSIACITVLLMGVPTFAATNQNTGMPEVTLPTIFITATRIPTKINNTIAQTNIIYSDDLQRYQGLSVIDVLKNQSGITVTQSGGLGTSSNFYIRGFDSKQVLILIDGVRYSSATLGSPSLNLLPADQIDRIEILYGASGSSLYGSDAMGGVIQIFTKGNDASNNAFAITAGYGSNDHYELGLNTQYVTDNTRLNMGISRIETGGFNAVANSDAPNYQPDKDGFEATNASVGIHHDFSNQLSAGFSALYSESTTDIDSSDSYSWTPPYDLIAPALTNAYADQQNGAGNIYAMYDTGDSSTKLAYGYSIDNTTTYETDNSQGDLFDTKQHSIRLENVSQVGSLLPNSKNGQNLGQVILGIEHLKQEVDSTTAYDEGSRTVSSGLLGYQYASNRYDFQTHYRLDDNSQYGRNATYNIGFALQPVSGLRVGTHYSTGFRTPTFNDLYYPGYSNPDLKPETTATTEAFVEWLDTNQRTRLTGYYTQADNLISGGQNNGEADIKGASLSSDWLINSFIFGLGYDYLEATNETSASPTFGNTLPYRPKNTGLVYLGYQQPTFDVRLEAKYTDERYTDMANTNLLDNHTLVNLNGNVFITPSLRGNLRIENLTDETYTLSNQFGTEYATDGINYFGSLTYTWQ